MSVALLALALGLGGVFAKRWHSRSAGALHRPPTPTWVSKISAKTRSTRPNIILAVYDARRRDDFSFGANGNRRNDTPFLAKLARDGLFFDNAVSSGCWTIPVHATLFSGLTVCDLGIDRYCPSFRNFTPSVMSLADVLRAAGYRTIAYADHPYFYGGDLGTSLVRGFDVISVINDFERYECIANVGRPDGTLARTQPLLNRPRMTVREMAAAVATFNRGDSGVQALAADRDPKTGLLFPKLKRAFSHSPYFEQRYGREFDRYVFADSSKPYFLFLNLHMCTVAEPDPRLFLTFWLQTLEINARRLGRRLEGPRGTETVYAALERNWSLLRLPQSPFERPLQYVKQIFDNRFYDATFEAICAYLQRRGLLDHAAIIATSDHGMGFGEHGDRMFFHDGAVPFEHMIRVPLVLRFPEESQYASYHGSLTTAVSLLDVFPTIVDLALGPNVFHRSSPVRGRSLLDRLARNDWEEVLEAESSLFPMTTRECPEVAGYARAIVDGRYKLITVPRPYVRTSQALWPSDLPLDAAWTRKGPRPDYVPLRHPVELLYDLSTDPGERHNIAPGNSAIVKALLAKAGSDWACQRTVGQDAESNSAAWDKDASETLKALGYTE